MKNNVFGKVSYGTMYRAFDTAVEYMQRNGKRFHTAKIICGDGDTVTIKIRVGKSGYVFKENGKAISADEAAMIDPNVRERLDKTRFRQSVGRALRNSQPWEGQNVLPVLGYVDEDMTTATGRLRPYQSEFFRQQRLAHAYGASWGTTTGRHAVSSGVVEEVKAQNKAAAESVLPEIVALDLAKVEERIMSHMAATAASLADHADSFRRTAITAQQLRAAPFFSIFLTDDVDRVKLIANSVRRGDIEIAGWEGVDALRGRPRAIVVDHTIGLSIAPKDADFITAHNSAFIDDTDPYISSVPPVVTKEERDVLLSSKPPALYHQWFGLLKRKGK